MSSRIRRLIRRRAGHPARVLPMSAEDRRFWAELHRRRSARFEERAAP